MSRPKKPINYDEELERINLRITHHQNSIVELEEKRDSLLEQRTAKEMSILTNYLQQNQLTAADILSQLNLTA